MCGKVLVTKQQAGNMSERKSIFTVLTVSHLYTIIDNQLQEERIRQQHKAVTAPFLFYFSILPYYRYCRGFNWINLTWPLAALILLIRNRISNLPKYCMNKCTNREYILNLLHACYWSLLSNHVSWTIKCRVFVYYSGYIQNVETQYVTVPLTSQYLRSLYLRNGFHKLLHMPNLSQILYSLQNKKKKNSPQ